MTVGNQMRQSCFEVQGLNDSLMEGTEFVPIIITAESDRNDIENIIVSRPNTTLQICELVFLYGQRNIRYICCHLVSS